MALDPKKAHQLDQETGPLGEFAVKLAAYHRSLQREGFTAEESLQIVINYQNTLMLNVLKEDENDGS